MRHTPILFAFTLSLLLFGTPTEAAPTVYALGEESAMEEGCFEPCLCPILIREDLGGTFLLEPAGKESGFTIFRVEAVDLSVGEPNGFKVSGNGTYRVSDGDKPQQELILDLEVDAGEVQRFSSGLVPAEALFPEVRVSVSKNGFYCYDRAFTLVAAPTDITPNRRSTWGSIKSFYSRD